MQFISAEQGFLNIVSYKEVVYVELTSDSTPGPQPTSRIFFPFRQVDNLSPGAISTRPSLI